MMPEPLDPPALSAHEEAKWRAEFESMGREAVRHTVNFHPGNLNPRRKLALAHKWLREQEKQDETRAADTYWHVKWTWYAALAAAILAAVGIAVAIIIAALHL